MYVDIHNHILPGIDDGARSMAETVHMLREAHAAGTAVMAATPHRAARGRRDSPPNWLRTLVAEAQAALAQHAVAVKVVAGLEIPITPRVAEELASGHLMTIGDTGVWALIEPPFEYLPADGEESLAAIVRAGFGVVLAHPERNSVLQEAAANGDLSFLEAAAALGVVFQLTTGSLLGHFGPHAEAAAKAIVSRAQDWKIVIASDTHDLSDRPPTLMRPARDTAAEICGPEEADRMVDSRPRAIVAGERAPAS
jgi:protein-tyrosine phosphatase